jgi:uncharacterized membrane protein
LQYRRPLAIIWYKHNRHKVLKNIKISAVKTVGNGEQKDQDRNKTASYKQENNSITQTYKSIVKRLIHGKVFGKVKLPLFLAFIFLVVIVLLGLTVLINVLKSTDDEPLDQASSQEISVAGEISDEEIEEALKQINTWGTIQSRQQDNLIISTHDGESLTLTLADESEVFKGEWQEPGETKDLTEGLEIHSATYHKGTREIIYIWYGL